MTPYPDWLNPGDNAWQLVAATLVGLMSIPGLAMLYGGLVQRKGRRAGPYPYRRTRPGRPVTVGLSAP